MKTLGMLTCMAGAVALYVHFHSAENKSVNMPVMIATPASTPSGEIVIAPFNGGTLVDRWQNPQSTAAPGGANR